MSDRPVGQEIDDKLKQQQIERMEEVLRAHREQIGVEKAKFQREQEEQWDLQEQRLRKQMKDLEFQSKLDQQYIWDAKSHISSYKHQIKQVEAKQESQQDSLFESKRLVDMEKIVRKKLELERIQKEKEEILANREKEEENLKAIDEEKNRRDVANLNNLEKILDKAEKLDQAIKAEMIGKAIREGEMDPVDAAKYATRLTEEENVKAKELLEQWLSTKRKEVADMTTQRIKELEAQRDELSKKEEEIVRKKELLHRSKQRGSEFLQQKELNNESINDHESLGDDFTIETDQDDEIPVEEVVQAAKLSVDPLNERIQGLREIKARTDALNRYLQRPYNGEEDIRKLKPDLDYSTYVAAMMLVHEIIDGAWEKIYKEMKEREDLERYRDYYNHKCEVYDQRIDFYQQKHVALHLVNDLVAESLEELLNEIGDEVVRIGHFAENIIANFLSGAVVAQRAQRENQAEIKQLMADLASEKGSELGNMTHQLYKREDIQVSILYENSIF